MREQEACLGEPVTTVPPNWPSEAFNRTLVPRCRNTKLEQSCRRGKSVEQQYSKRSHTLFSLQPEAIHCPRCWLYSLRCSSTDPDQVGGQWIGQ